MNDEISPAMQLADSYKMFAERGDFDDVVYGADVIGTSKFTHQGAFSVLLVLDDGRSVTATFREVGRSERL